MPASAKRQLKAIAFADIAGYTAMMESDEQDALLRLRRFREALEQEVPAGGGRVVQYYGDGALMVFDSSVDALACAVRLQERFREAPVIPVRIGLHTGDIVTEGGNIYGDSVNLASRIESCGIPGAVLFSERVARDLKGHTGFRVVPLGRLAFKNVEEPQTVFALANEGFPVPRRRDLRGKLHNGGRWPAGLRGGAVLLFVLLAALILWPLLRQAPLPGGSPAEQHAADPSVAVLPFRWLSATAGDEYFSEGVAEAIRGKLAQVSGLRVTSMTSTLRYAGADQPIREIARELRVGHLLEGSIQKDSNRVRINVSLVDAGADRQVWVRSFDEQLTDIFSVQNRIAAEVARAMTATLNAGEAQRLQHLATRNISAYEYYMAGRRDLYRSQYGRDTALLARARDNFRKALLLDSSYAQPYVGLAQALLGRAWGPIRGDDQQRDSALRLLERAIALDPGSDQAYAARGEIRWKQREPDAAVADFRRAVDLAPSNTGALMGLAEIYMSQRRFEQAIPMMMRALTLDPRNQRDPFNKELYARLAGLYLEAERYADAEALLKRALELFPGDEFLYWEYRSLLMATGRFTEALDIAQKAYNAGGPSFINTDQLALCYLFAGRYDEAERLYRRLYNLIQSDSPANATPSTFRHRLAFALWQQGKREEARRLVAEHLAAEKAIIAEGTLYRGQEYDIAAAYAFTGNRAAAYEWLERMPYWSVTYRLLRVDPLFDNLRGEARFQRIMTAKEEEVAQIRGALEKAEKEEGAFRLLKS